MLRYTSTEKDIPQLSVLQKRHFILCSTRAGILAKILPDSRQIIPNRLQDNYGNIVRNEPGCPDNDIPFPVCSTFEPSTRKIETKSSSKSPT